MNKIFLGGYIAFWVALSAASVGDMPDVSDAYSWDLPFLMFALLAPVGLLGYLAGKDDSGP